MPFRILSPDATELGIRDDPDVARGLLAAASVDAADPHRARISELIDAHADIAVRTCRPGHLTGSAFVIDPSRPATLLLFHTKLQRWLQPGGHADGDTNLAHVALREATEETGIAGLRVVVPAIDVDVHEVNPPNEDAHLHLDVRFLVLAPAGSMPTGNHESQDLRWIAEDALDAFDLDEGLRRMAAKGFKVARTITVEEHA